MKTSFTLILGILCLSSCAQLNDSIDKEVALNKKTLTSHRVEFITPDANIAKGFDNPKFKQLHADLAEVLPDFKVNICVNSPNAPMKDDLISKCVGNQDFTIGDMIEDATSIGVYDLNKDGKEDLIIAMGGNTGLSGLGACGTSEYRFYENIGNDYRPLGKAKVVNAQTLYIYDNAGKNKFSSLLWKNEIGCDGSPLKGENYQNYNYKNASYY